MSGIQKIISDIMTSPVEKKFTTFAVIVVWSMMIEEILLITQLLLISTSNV